MNKPKLSVLVPGIRTINWQRLYNSIQLSFRGTWEIIFVGPYDIPHEMLRKHGNINYIKDWGSPIRCQQIALTKAQGDWITWGADDGYFLPEALDIGFANLAGHDMNYKTVIMGKYLEGEKNNDHMKRDSYYMLNQHDGSKCRWMSPDVLMLNVGLVSRKLLIEVGGWDCQFEVCPMSYNDLALRLQNYETTFVIQKEIMFQCGHMPGHQGDHGPVHDAQIHHDEPLFKKIYYDKECLNRIKIDLNNWQKSPKKWHRRFKDD